MLIDNLLVLHATTLTASAATTSHIDQGAANRAIGNEMYMECLVTTALASAGNAATLTLSLQGDSDTAFGTVVTLASSAAIAEASLVAGYVIRVRVPALATAYRYLRGYFTVGTEDFTSGAVSVYFTQTPFIEI